MTALLATTALGFSSMPATCETAAKEPPIPGKMPGTTKPSILLAQDVDWPPYAYLAMPPEGDYTVAGFGRDVAMGLSEVCDIEVEVTQATWAGCWSDDKIGADAKAGVYHGCMTYTHTIGSRPRWMEFSHSILENNKPAGLLTTLDAAGAPKVSTSSDLSGLKVVDVNGWAPTQDGLAVTKNACTGNTAFSGYEWVTPSEATLAAYENENDRALKTLLDGEADAMFVYADQAYTYSCADNSVQPAWDCDLWSGFGTKFAYIHTGMFETAFNGTTLTMSKRGSGLSKIVNPCIDKFITTKSYYDICVKHDFVDYCYANEFFPEGSDSTDPWELPTSEQTGDCSSGYCGC